MKTRSLSRTTYKVNGLQPTGSSKIILPQCERGLQESRHAKNLTRTLLGAQSLCLHYIESCTTHRYLGTTTLTKWAIQAHSGGRTTTTHQLIYASENWEKIYIQCGPSMMTHKKSCGSRVQTWLPIVPKYIYNPITTLGFSAIFIFQFDNTKR